MTLILPPQLPSRATTMTCWGKLSKSSARSCPTGRRKKSKRRHYKSTMCQKKPTNSTRSRNKLATCSREVESSATIKKQVARDPPIFPPKTTTTLPSSRRNNWLSKSGGLTPNSFSECIPSSGARPRIPTTTCLLWLSSTNRRQMESPSSRCMEWIWRSWTRKRFVSCKTTSDC